MTILDLLTGRKANESLSLSDLADSLIPKNLPAHVATLDLAREYRGIIADVHELCPPGDRKLQLRQQLNTVDALIGRLDLAGRMRSAIAQRETDQVAAQKRLAAANKGFAAADAAHTEAAAKQSSMAQRLDALKASLQSLDSALASEIRAAVEQLDAAVHAGDQAAEVAASKRLAELQGAQVVPSPESAAIALRIERTAAQLAELTRSVHAAAQSRSAALRERSDAHMECAKVACDKAIDRYALEVLQVIRAADEARSHGFDDLTNGLHYLESATFWMGDHRRGWFDAVDPRLSAGPVRMARVMRLVAEAVKDPALDLESLRADLRAAA